MHKNITVTAPKNTNILRFQYNTQRLPDSYMGYVFFGREFVMGTDPADFQCNFGYSYPFNMAAFFDRKKAALIIIETPAFKSIRLHKDNDSCYYEFLFQIPADQIRYQVKTIERCRHFLTELIQTYQSWFMDHYGKLPESSQDLSGCFNIKRYFFNRSDKFFGSFFDPPRTIFAGEEVRLKELIREDCKELGSIDAALLFDYSFKDGIRCGNREPFPFGKEKLTKLNAVLSDIKRDQQIHFFAYFDPCFVEYGSCWDDKYRNLLMLESDNNTPASIWGAGIWHPNLGSGLWQAECCQYLKDVIAGMKVDGIYLDEIGNGTQFKGKVKGQIYDQIIAENRFVARLQQEVKINKWMCEYPPIAREATKFDIVLSDTRTLVNIYRFIFPKLKFVRIINCDMPIGNSTSELNKAFFNGEGLWLDHDIRNKQWYPDNLKRTIRTQTLFKKKYATFLESSDAVHYWNNGKGMAVNRFSAKGNVLYTVINESSSPSYGQLTIEAEGDIHMVFGENCQFTQNRNQVFLHMPPFSVCALLD